MAVATAPQPQAQPATPGISFGMMGMYIFLCSEIMFFGALFATYFYLFGSHPGQWPPAGTQAVRWWPLPTINTFVLVSSGVTCHFALEALRHNGLPRRVGQVAAGLMVLFLLAELVSAGLAIATDGAYVDASIGLVGALGAAVAIAAMLGVGPFKGRRVWVTLWVATIVLGAMFEFGQAYEFLTAHINLRTNEFASAFFIMTGFHGGHVAGGIVLLLLILYRGLKGQFSPQHHVGPAAVTLYWHFVDVVWFFLYGILYIGVTAGGSSG
jgi:heme/copper-type cytochrome/quinol oxidase subunit 3